MRLSTSVASRSMEVHGESVYLLNCVLYSLLTVAQKFRTCVASKCVKLEVHSKSVCLNYKCMCVPAVCTEI